jgi:hypothetical protein
MGGCIHDQVFGVLLVLAVPDELRVEVAVAWVADSFDAGGLLAEEVLGVSGRVVEALVAVLEGLNRLRSAGLLTRWHRCFPSSGPSGRG